MTALDEASVRQLLTEPDPFTGAPLSREEAKSFIARAMTNAVRSRAVSAQTAQHETRRLALLVERIADEIEAERT